MSRIRSIAALFAITALLTAAFPVGAKPKDANINEKSERTITVSCIEESSEDVAGTITFEGETRLWPPNHKYTDVGDIVISATDEDTGADANETADDAAIEVAVDHEQYVDDVEQNGSGNTDDDAKPAMDMDTGAPTATTDQWQVRAERSGQDQTGREYTFMVTAEFSDSDTDGSSEPATACTVEFKVCVPHDMRKATRADECPNPDDGDSVEGVVPDNS